MVNMSNRGFAGGGKMKPIDPATTDFDLVCVGKFFSSRMIDDSV